MSLTAIFVVAVFGLTVAGLIRFQNSPEKIFAAALCLLFVSNIISTEQVINSFANKGLLTLILLMVCSLALEKTKLLQLVTSYIIRSSYKATWFRLYILTALSSSILNNTAVVSTMLAPIRNNVNHPASKLLLPLSYAAILGGTLTLVGTSTNLIVNSMVIDYGLPSLGFFDFTLVGICLVSGCGVLLFFMSRFLPSNARVVTLAADYLIDMEVSTSSSLIGKSIDVNGLRNLESVFLVEILRNERLISPVAPTEIIQANDRLIFSGDIKKVTLLNRFDGLSSFAHESGLPLSNLSEVVVRPESMLVRRTLKRVGFRALFDAAVVAIKRDGTNVSGKLGDVVLQAGDYLVLAVGDDFKSRHNLSKNFFLLSDVQTENQLRGGKEKIAIYGFFAAIALAAFDILPLFKGMLMLLAALVFSGALSSNEIMQRLPKNIWVIIASALALSQALKNSGAFDGLNTLIQANQGILTPLVALIIIYVLTWLFTELVTNNAAAALMFPVAMELGSSLGMNPMAVIMAVAYGASASFISPYGYQTNLMVYNAGQYRIKDFVKIGAPMCLLYGIIVIASINAFIGL
ncbi:SLC13 family permease [Alginatibacterium sediminis]|uniref:SLC13 family permease n=1 Tax=Alginatibacterium sediminis TaxID=2164068 RepID=A0A420E5L4_9ALTE|nr:SLC13 family permease [Alginatibacterium sediminis]RKF13142.1 SLC13 family permease [Alginatibacterium sediminis]